MFTKRVWLVLVVVTALLGGSLGVLTASAAHPTPEAQLTLQQSGKAWLGIGISDSDEGVTVVEIAPGSPAETAGLKVGDVILAINDNTVSTSQELVDAVQTYQPGDEVTLSVKTKGETHDVKVTLGERPATTTITPQWPNEFHGILDSLGATFEVTDEGLLIKEVHEDSVLAKAGFQTGDVITEINGEKVPNLEGRALLKMLGE
jgi:S1-C subfamily serine protease